MYREVCFWIFICVLLVAHSNAEWPRQGNLKNIGGLIARQTDYPYLASLQTADETLVCGGSIASPITVLTAAHCVTTEIGNVLKYKATSDLKIVAGTAFLRRGSSKQVRSPMFFKTHPAYKSKESVSYDAAIVILEHPLTFNRRVQPMKIVSTNVEIAMNAIGSLMEENHACWVVGWGGGDFDQSPGTKNRLKRIPVRLLKKQECQDKAERLAVFRGSQKVCVFGEEGTALGDSGGPLVCDGNVYGVQTWASDAYVTGVWGIYTTPEIIINLLTGSQESRAAENTDGQSQLRQFHMDKNVANEMRSSIFSSILLIMMSCFM